MKSALIGLLLIVVCSDSMGQQSQIDYDIQASDQFAVFYEMSGGNMTKASKMMFLSNMEIIVEEGITDDFQGAALCSSEMMYVLDDQNHPLTQHLNNLALYESQQSYIEGVVEACYQATGIFLRKK